MKQSALQKNFLIAGIAAVLVIGVVSFRNILLKRKNEKHRRELAENELHIQRPREPETIIGARNAGTSCSNESSFYFQLS